MPLSPADYLVTEISVDISRGFVGCVVSLDRPGWHRPVNIYLSATDDSDYQPMPHGRPIGINEPAYQAVQLLSRSLGAAGLAMKKRVERLLPAGYDLAQANVDLRRQETDHLLTIARQDPPTRLALRRASFPLGRSVPLIAEELGRRWPCSCSPSLAG